MSARFTRSLSEWIARIRRTSCSVDAHLILIIAWEINCVRHNAQFFREIKSHLYAGQNGGTRARCPDQRRSWTISRLSVVKINRVVTRRNRVKVWKIPTCLLRVTVLQPAARVHLDIRHPRRSRRWSLECLTLVGGTRLLLSFFSALRRV